MNCQHFLNTSFDTVHIILHFLKICVIIYNYILYQNLYLFIFPIYSHILQRLFSINNKIPHLTKIINIFSKKIELFLKLKILFNTKRYKKFLCILHNSIFFPYLKGLFLISCSIFLLTFYNIFSQKKEHDFSCSFFKDYLEYKIHEWFCKW